jgi:hypothetical protein
VLAAAAAAAAAAGHCGVSRSLQDGVPSKTWVVAAGMACQVVPQRTHQMDFIQGNHVDCVCMWFGYIATLLGAGWMYWLLWQIGIGTNSYSSRDRDPSRAKEDLPLWQHCWKLLETFLGWFVL